MEPLNLVGKPCPIPVIEAKKALKDAKPGDKVLLLVDNEIASQNLEKMAKGLGHGFLAVSGEGASILVTLTAGNKSVDPDDNRGLVVVIGQLGMGHGPSEELGQNLMKAFINSLTELETVPEYMLFFNGGVFLTTEGSQCLEDLGRLVEKGTIIGSCGACLNYYKLTEKLKVGSVTNMYAIAGTMAQAKKLVNI